MAAIDIENFPQLLGYLAQNRVINRSTGAECRILAGGVSNKTVLVSDPAGPDVVVKQALGKLRVAEPWESDPHRLMTEANALTALQELLPEHKVPNLLFRDEEQGVIVMEAFMEPAINWKDDLLNGIVNRQIVNEFAGALARIHSRSTGKPIYRDLFANRAHFETLRLDPYYRYTAANLPDIASFMENLIVDTLDQRLCLVHGDYSPKNILVQDGRMVLLDFEVMHYGDSAFDVGFALTHFLSKANHLSQYRHTFVDTAAVFWETYSKQFTFDRQYEARAVRHTLACLLARVSGKSPLEYLDDAERSRQQRICVRILEGVPEKMNDLVNYWQTSLDAGDN